MRKDLEERWLQVHQRELRGIEKERELSKDAVVAKVAVSVKPKARKGRNDAAMNGANPVSPNQVPKDQLSSGELEVEVVPVPHVRRDDGSVEPDSGLKESPLPSPPFADQEQDSEVKSAARQVKSSQKGRGEVSRNLKLSLDGGPSGSRAGRTQDKDTKRGVPSPRPGKRGENTGPITSARSHSNT